jgi:FAD/FMN-containing dehydrogenase
MAAPSPQLLATLGREFPPGFLSQDPGDLSSYGTDWTRAYTPAPSAVVFPRSTEEVVRLVRLCRDAGVAMVPSGGRTGLAGGAVARAGELVVSFQRMHRIGTPDPMTRTLHVQAGAVTQAVHERCQAEGMTWPIDLAAKGSSQIGGNISTNAGGVKVIRYGHTRNWVLGLQVVTVDGEVLELGGELEKDNTGTDLRQLFIGSEGTLGFVTEATLKLTRLPRRLDVMLFAIPDLSAALALLREIRQSQLLVSAFEFFTARCSRRVHMHRGVKPPFDREAPCYVLVEVENAAEELLHAFTEATLEHDWILDGTLATSLGQAQTLWTLREGISESIAATALPHKNDVALPVRALDDFCRELEAVFAQRYPGWEICLFGHVGDGNIHINVLKPDDLDRAAFHARTEEADREVFALVQRHRGSISAEHGIGLVKKKFLSYSRNPAEIAMLKAIKRALDPDNLLNPGKIFDL